jgi:predicted AAA+ superfamily ATPase
MTSQSRFSYDDGRAEGEIRGRLVESAVGAHLANAASVGECEVYYWRERNREVDFVVRIGRAVVAIEVKSGRARAMPRGLADFAARFKSARTLLVGGEGVPIEDFLLQPVAHWVSP